MINITIPCHWNKRIVDQILDLGSLYSNTKVTEIYGTLARGPIGHGRAPDMVPDVSKEYAVDFRKYIKKKGLQFVYLINAPLSFESSFFDQAPVERYLDWIINCFGADALMVTSHDLMELIRAKFSEVPIYISTIAGICNYEQLNSYLDICPKRVVVHHDANRNFSDLEELAAKANKKNIAIEIMLTESCLRQCPNRKEHYEYLGGARPDRAFHATCNASKVLYPARLLRANFVRPEDIDIYQSMGINIFKITGRSKPAEWLPLVVSAYLKGYFKGNLIRLLGIDPVLKAEKWIKIENGALDGFLSNFPISGKAQEENAYCNQWIYLLYKSGKFRVSDGSKYSLSREKELCCTNPGKKVLQLL